MSDRSWVGRLSNVAGMISAAVLNLSAVGLLLMTIVIGWQVFGRYVLNASPAWSESLALILMLYYVLIAAAAGVREGFHLGLRIIVDNLPDAPRKWAIVAALLLVLLFGTLMTVNGVELMVYTADHVVPTLGISRAVAYVPFVLSGALMVFFAIERSVAALAGELEAKS